MKKIICLLTAVVLLFTAVCPAFAAEEEKYPYVFIHGMMGWGENGSGFIDGPYWGMKVADIPAYFRENGYEAAVPTVGPMSSAWDRACEVYAQLTGTVVDYGAAHSAACGHARFGRDYTGRALLDNWNGTSPVNVITHSFGGPAALVFSSLMEYGSAEEIAASPDDCSELFKGGHPGTVRTVSTLASPHNGTPLANILYDIKFPVFAAAFLMNVLDIGTDYMLDQFGITKDPVTGEKACFDPAGIWALYKSDDHCAYEMTIKGARELYARFPAAEHTYYFSYSGDVTEGGILGGRRVSKEFSSGIFGFSGSLISLCAGKYFAFEKIGKEWAANDGLVPVVSARYPFSHPHADYSENTELLPGVWYAMPTVSGASHGYHVGGNRDTLIAFYDSLMDVTENK